MGENPEEKHSLSCGELMRIPERGSEHSSLVEGTYSCRSGAPDKRFFHDLAWDHYPYAPGPDTSILLRKNKFTALLRIPAGSAVSGESAVEIEDYRVPLSEIPAEERVDELVRRIRRKYKATGLLNPSKGTGRFVFKGYARVFKRLTFQVGNIIVQDE